MEISKPQFLRLLFHIENAFIEFKIPFSYEADRISVVNEKPAKIENIHFQFE